MPRYLSLPSKRCLSLPSERWVPSTRRSCAFWSCTCVVAPAKRSRERATASWCWRLETSSRPASTRRKSSCQSCVRQTDYLARAVALCHTVRLCGTVWHRYSYAHIEPTVAYVCGRAFPSLLWVTQTKSNRWCLLPVGYNCSFIQKRDRTEQRRRARRRPVPPKPNTIVSTS